VLEGEAEIVIAGKKVNIVRISSLQTAEDCGHLASWAASQPVTRGATSSNVSSGETN